MRGNLLAALLVRASLVLSFRNGSAQAAVGPAPLPAAHFDAGRAAYRDGRYESALHELMLAVMARPEDDAAREYMRRAAEKLVEQDLTRVSAERRALLEAYRDGLDSERRRAETWTAWLREAEAARKGRRWAEALDDAQRVVDDNPLHKEAKDARKAASYGLTRTLGDSRRLSRRDLLVYRGLFAAISSQPERARRYLSDALALGEGSGELEDDRVRFWLARVTPIVPQAPKVVPPAPKPVPPAPKPQPKPEPKIQHKRKRGAVVPRMPEVVEKPGQRAYEEGAAKLGASDLAGAVEAFQRSVAEAPERADARQALAKARLSLEEQDSLKKAEAERLYSLGLVLYAQGKRPEAIERWKKAVELDPSHGFAARALSHAQKELEEEAR